jgi:serine/threonine protein kinase
MATDTCPACGQVVERPATPVTFLICTRCASPFVPTGARTLSIVARAREGREAGPENITLSREFVRRYRLGRILGRGATGMVCQATHIDTRREVAVKFLLRVARQDLAARFLREGKLMAQIRHPNVVTIFDFDEMDAHPYMVTELVDGGTLRDRLMREGGAAADANAGAGTDAAAPAQGRLGVNESVRVALDCLAGLSACHAAGVVHRDLKPENILFTRSGQAKIADLGVARIHGSDDDSVTLVGSLIGTPRYMAPEQARTEVVGIAADLYSMSVVLYEMLAGRPPFDAQAVEDLIHLQISGEPPPIRDVAGQLPDALAAVVHRGLAKRPSERPLSADAFAHELRRAIEPPGSGRRASDRLRRSGRVSQRMVRSSPMPAAASAAETAADLPGRGGWRLLLLAGGWMAALAVAVYLVYAGPDPRDPRHASHVGELADLEDATRQLSSFLERRTLSEVRMSRLARRLPLPPAAPGGRDAASGAVPEPGSDTDALAEEVRQAAQLERRDLEQIAPLADQVRSGVAGGPPGTERELRLWVRVLALHWLTWTRYRSLEEQERALSRVGGGRTSGGGMSAAATGPLADYLRACGWALERPAAMPSTAGPELAELLGELAEVGRETYRLDWDGPARQAIDSAARSLTARLERVPGPSAGLVRRASIGLWTWGAMEGSPRGEPGGLAGASGAGPGDRSASPHDHREETIEALRALRAFLSPTGQRAIDRLLQSARHGLLRSAPVGRVGAFGAVPDR